MPAGSTSGVVRKGQITISGPNGIPTLDVSRVGSTSGVVRKRQLTITQPKRYSSSDNNINSQPSYNVCLEFHKF
jgi:hypothetical protein